MTMSAGRMLRLSTLAAVASVLLAMPQHSEGDDVLGLMRLKLQGCLPEDFRVPEDLKEALAECKGPINCDHATTARSHHGHGVPKRKMLKLLGTLQMLPKAVCMVDSLDMVAATGADVEEMKELLGSVSANETWTQRQMQNVDMCQQMMDTALTPTQQAVYMAFCFKKMAAAECKMQKLAQIGGEQMKELVLIQGDQCFWTILRPKDKVEAQKALVKCAKEVGLNITAKPPSMEDIMSNHTTVLEIIEKKKQLLPCIMRHTGELEGDTVNYDRITEVVTNLVGPQRLKDLKLQMVGECQAQGVTTGEEASNCWYSNAWKYCNGGVAHLMAQATQPDWATQAGAESTSSEAASSEETEDEDMI